MGYEKRSKGRGRIDDEAMGVFLSALRNGSLVQDAARAAGFALSSFNRLRKRDRAFAEAWEDMMELSAAPRFIAPQNGRPLQLRKSRCVRFVDWRKDIFLAHFAGTCDEAASAESAGVSRSTVIRHRQRDPDFAARRQAALEQGVATLEAEALRQRLEAQQKLRDGILPEGEVTQEFERILKLLERYERRNGRLADRSVAHARRAAWTFDEAIAAIEVKLNNLGIPIVGDEQ
jgi:hypothetical protein